MEVIYEVPTWLVPGIVSLHIMENSRSFEILEVNYYVVGPLLPFLSIKC
jgi:hypothetical protein